METAPSQVFIWAFQTLAKKDKKIVSEWIKKHENDSFDEELNDFEALSLQRLNGAFGDAEPNYTIDDCIEINPKFNNERR
jgi:hypothetical protein